jgi:cell division protein FtsB
LPSGWHPPGDVLQLEEEIRRTAADGEKRLKQLEDENSKLRKLVADLSLDKEMLQDVIRRQL